LKISDNTRQEDLLLPAHLSRSSIRISILTSARNR